MSNFKIFVISGGFYYFGEQVASEEGFLAMKNYAMFGGFSGGKGVAGVARGDKDAKVVLDRFMKDEIGIWPISACYGIHSSIDLYNFKGATLR